MSFTDPLQSVPDFDAGDAEWLHLLVGDWQMVADLGVGDLLLCFPEQVVHAAESPTGQPLPVEGGEFRVLAHARPTTGPTAYQKDMVGELVSEDIALPLRRAWIDQRIETVGPTQWSSEWSNLSPRAVTLVPLVRNNRTIAVVSLTADPHHDRLPSHMELVYRQSAGDLLRMANEGTWPDFAVRIDSRRGAPRVGDGLIRLGTDGVVEFCSPNGLSTFRRLGLQGDLTGQNLLQAARQLSLNAPGVDETLAPVLAGTMPWRAELSAVKASASLRAFPLRRGGERAGALVLCRDVTELRRRDLQLVSKDATIREIHHRVKNNLQTVSALLRLQSRRMNSAEGRNGLQQAMRRVSSIARVHESLSHEISEDVDFDELIRHQVKLAVETASATQHVRTEVRGNFGRLPSKSATSVALVVNELVANAVEHGLKDRDGTVTLSARHLEEEVDESGAAHRVLEIAIDDDGRGMGDAVIEEAGVSAYRPPSEGEGLGMQIVRTLVASELRGSIRWQPGRSGGTSVVITARFPQQASGRSSGHGNGPRPTS